MATTFKALLVKEEDGAYKKQVSTLDLQQLPHQDVLIKVAYSSLNYKDALSAAGNKGVTRKFPHVPGIDAAGTIINSNHAALPPGLQVLVTGYDLGMNTWGGFGEYISVPAGYVLPLPEGLSAREAMCFGTAGLTAGLSINKIVQAGITKGKVAVSGGNGGVGSIAIAILAKLGYEVTVITGREDKPYFIDTLGATAMIQRETFVETADKKAMSPATYAACVDTTGGALLSGMIKSTQYGGVVTCCGNIGGAELHTSIFPFILRGVQLSGIDSVEQPLAVKQQIWEQLSSNWKPARLSSIVQEITLEELPEKLDQLLAGKAKGRYLLKHEQ